MKIPVEIKNKIEKRRKEIKEEVKKIKKKQRKKEYALTVLNQFPIIEEKNIVPQNVS
jgi:hypothetical protein